MTPSIPCTKCGKSIDVCDGVEAIICPKCVLGEENWLDHKVLTPDNCAAMREERGMTIPQACKLADTQTFPQQIKAFEAGRGKCPTGIVKMIYEWWIGG